MRYLLTLLFSLRLLGADYYVATTGNDTTGDGSAGTPWATVTKAALTAAAGDTVHVSTGLYSERVTLTTDGTEGNPITFTGPSDRSATNSGFYLNAANYITIRYFSCSNYDAEPDTFDYNYSDILVRGHHNNIISNDCFGEVGNGIAALDSGGDQAAYFNLIQGNRCWSNHNVGIYSSGTNVTCIQNEVWGITISNLVNTNVAGNGDGLWVFTKNGVIASNHVHGLFPQGTVAHVDGFQTWEDGPATPRNGIKDSTISHNFFDCPSQVCANLQSVSNNLIYNNVFRSHALANISYDTDGTTNLPWSENPPCKLLFYNNTFIIQSNAVAQANEINMQGIIINERTNGFGNIFSNNIFISDYSSLRFINAHSGGGQPGNAAGNYNLFYATNGNLSIAQYGYDYGSSDITNSNPLLVEPFAATLNYTFTAASPAKDAGTTISAFSNDYYGVTRPQGVAWDIGAYEYVAPATVMPPQLKLWIPAQ